MSNDVNHKSKPYFSTECLPGSVAEQKEKERIEEFRRARARVLAEEERNKPATDALREQKYREACKANEERNGPRGVRREFIKRVDTPPVAPAEPVITPSRVSESSPISESAPE